MYEAKTPWVTVGLPLVFAGIALSATPYLQWAWMPTSFFVILGTVINLENVRKERWFPRRMNKHERLILSMIKNGEWDELNRAMRDSRVYDIVHENPKINRHYKKYKQGLKDQQIVESIQNSREEYWNEAIKELD